MKASNQKIGARKRRLREAEEDLEDVRKEYKMLLKRLEHLLFLIECRVNAVNRKKEELNAIKGK